ncbi:glycoside hydrolase family 3 C-terminal domain-containing protein [Phenylobacterium sp. LjRoot225]|uniref:glycoside hydrolase family 3 C-terminal domain-containing protein n=1 Tax=Phenylobacterium sp. LjRoot225 TaxID=3342285 RepID=UPI003ECEC884
MTRSGFRPQASAVLRRRTMLKGALAAWGALGLRPARAAPIGPGPKGDIDARVRDLLAQMTVAEKVSLLSGATRFATAAIPRLGVPSIRMADGPNGIRANETWPATVFPASVAMAATWDPELGARVAGAIGREALAYDYSIVLGPAMNIQRVPLGGRNFEYFSEDPHLTGRIATAWTKGLQAVGVLATPKHFAANNQEHERRRVSANVSERALREIYLPGFRAVVTEADPGLLMTAYNRVNGVFASENRWLLRDVLKGEWGFKGVVLSDWGATHSTAPAITAGLDLEMPGPGIFFGEALVKSVESGEVGGDVLDEAAGRMLRMIVRTGAMDGRSKTPLAVIDSPEHRAVSLAAAEAAVTLLKNDGAALPLVPARLRSVAVIGPNADARVIQGGGSSEVTPIRVVTPLEGLKAALPKGVEVLFSNGVLNDRFPPVADPRLFSTSRKRSDRGLTRRYWTHGAIEGAAAETRTDDVFMRFYFGHELAPDPQHKLAMQWTGYFWPSASGEHLFSLCDHGTTTVWLDGKPIISPSMADESPPLYDMLEWRARYAKVFLEAGRPYAFRMDFLPAGQKYVAYRLGVQSPAGSIAEAAAAARGADAAIVFAGSSTTSESETADRPDLKLFGEQDALIEAVAAANPRTIVVLNMGGPVEMPWVDKVPAIVAAWFLGGETGHALANVLLGKVNPSGKLPVTFPKKLEDNPTYKYYLGGLEAEYGEDLLVGYRWYDAKEIEPLFPFGHGLSYTRFVLSDLAVGRDGEGWRATCSIRNAGARAGAEVVQLYLETPRSTGEPLRQLKGFQRLYLEPGEQRDLSFAITPDDLSYWDAGQKRWRFDPGVYRAHLGRSSRDLPLSAAFTALGHS